MSTCQGLSQCVNALGRHDRRCPAAPVTTVDVDALDKLREALAEAMASSARGNTYAQWAATILPVVDRIANERAAAELRAAAEQIRALADGPVPAINDPFDAVVILRARADDVDPS